MPRELTEKLENPMITVMKRPTIITGTVLIILGGGFYLGIKAGGEQPHWTALIPAIPGVFLVLLGILSGVAPGWNKHIMHGSMAIGVLVVVSGLTQGARGLADEPGVGTIASLSMALVAFVYLVAGVRSFINARRDGGDTAQ